MRIIVFVLFLLAYAPARSAVIQVRIYTGTNVSSLSLAPAGAGYSLFADLVKRADIGSLKAVSLKAAGDSVWLKLGDSLLGKFASVTVSENSPDSLRNGSLKLKINAQEKGQREYPGGIRVSAEKGLLKVINVVDIEQYTRGVIKSEVGVSQSVEFYKVKAIIIRTYTLSNLRRHELEHFHLCDQTHCQVYRGKVTNENIVKGVAETKNQVLVDTAIMLVNASFFSNCGGQTCNSEDVWSKALPYLRSGTDTFCTRQPSAYWQKKIPKSEWLKYFSDKHGYPVNDTAAVKALLSFTQYQRKVYFTEQPVKIPLKVLRDDWKLRSTYFSVEVQGDMVVLKGRGFGHGVGLCQEGAMAMAKKGYTAKDIIDHYYRDVTVIDLNKLEFFQEE
ncbi:MAG: SpoIID/LytB domain-containing protein [Bacteroidota bacterium]